MRQILLLSTLVLTANLAVAQYNGPSAIMTPTTTIQQLLKKGKDNQYASLEGHVIQHLEDDHYLFADQTGQINVEIEQHYLINTKIDDKTKIRLNGKLDKDFNERPELEVKSLSVLP